MGRACRLLLLVVLPTLGFAQEFHVGLKAGVPLTSSFDTKRAPLVSSPIRRYTLGASAELRFGAHFGIEVDVLYKRIGYSATSFCGLRCQPQVISQNPEIITMHISDAVDAKANSWEFPILAKYRLPGTIHPYFAGGFAARRVKLASGRCLSTDERIGSGVPGGFTVTTEIPCRSRLPDRSFAGIAVSTGLEMGREHFRVLPEFRYTRWFQNDSWGIARFASNQAEFLLGFLF